MTSDETTNPSVGGRVISEKWSPPIERVVTKRVGNDVWYRVQQGGRTSDERLSLLATWRRWCRNNAARNVRG